MMFMRFAFKLVTFSLMLLAQVACVSHNNLSEGIECFRIQNYRAAFIHLKPEAAKGQPDAQYAVGYMYYYGQGVIENRKEAWFWINKAAAAGQPEAIQAVKILKHEPKMPVRDPLDPLLYHSDSNY